MVGKRFDGRGGDLNEKQGRAKYRVTTLLSVSMRPLHCPPEQPQKKT